jgi:hypothetical protein
MSSRLSTIGNVLVIAGSLVGVATVAAVVTGAEIHLSREMMQLLIYKGFGAMAVGLIIAGSWIARRGRQEERDQEIAESVGPELLSGASLAGENHNDRTRVHDEVKSPDSSTRR